MIRRNKKRNTYSVYDKRGMVIVITHNAKIACRMEDSQNPIRKWLENGCWWDNMGNDSWESCADSIFSAVE